MKRGKRDVNQCNDIVLFNNVHSFVFEYPMPINCIAYERCFLLQENKLK